MDIQPLRNLLRETIAALEANGKTPADVRWVGTRDGEHAITWDDFARRAKLQYDGGFGHLWVLEHLVAVGDDWWLERGEYDGSEWWEFKQRPALKDGARGRDFPLWEGEGDFTDADWYAVKYPEAVK